MKKTAIKNFVEYWLDKGYEKGESQPFWLSLLRNVFGIAEPERLISFEAQVHLDHTSFIDGMIPSTRVMIEQKSRGKDLRKPIKQSDGSLLSPFSQAKRYITELPLSKHPRWIVTCNFEEFLIYDMENPSAEPESVLLKNLEKEYYRLQFLVNTESKALKKEMEVSVKAGELVGKLYDELLSQYKNPDETSLHCLNILCVRLVFCLYAEDAGLFGGHTQFHDYLKAFEPRYVRRAIIDLFKVLDTKPEERDPYLDDNLAEFPYVNGGLFADDNIEIPNFTQEICDLLLHDASENFDWSDISPTIFGAVFESTLNPETRRSGGMHYTSIENIHKVTDPLFLNELKSELNEILEIKIEKTRKSRLETFRTKLSQLTFLDPACGSGNFLTETYLSLRRLENEALRAETNQITLGDDITNPIKVSISQFYGIEINDFAVTVAKTALWIAEAQMIRETENIVNTSIDFLPLKAYANISEGNALRTDWENAVPKENLNYIIGNPPFVGARLMSKEQKSDVISIFSEKWKGVGNLDYVSCWYKKSADLMKNTNIRTALVSTNSVSQGESVSILWKPLFDDGIHIDFAHRTFSWDSEANSKAHVHCVIIGFSYADNSRDKWIYNDNRPIKAKNINGYLIDAPNIFIESRKNPICDVPQIGIGNKPIDGGYYLFTKEEMDDFIKKEPKSKAYFHKCYGAREFINQEPRYCLYLASCPPNELRNMPECMARIEAVRKYRLESPSSGTRKLAETPTRFHVTNIPKDNYMIIPRVSSENRRYVPIGFMDENTIVTDSVQIIPDATLYNFGILTSNVHMAWMRAVGGRLKNDYRYSKDIVYNNFPWCSPTEEQKAKIEKTAQAILDARALYPNCSLADLYNELTMPSELRTAHQQNDRAVMKAYGFDIKSTTESSCVAELMNMYKKLAENK